MKKIKCFLIGHREATDELIPKLIQVIETHVIEYHVEEFIVGTYGGFDHAAARALAVVKQRHPHIRLILLLPYHPTKRTVQLPKHFDNSWYPEGLESVPPRFAIIRANCYAIDHADCLIAYVWHAASNARNALEYAQRHAESHGLRITLVGHDGSAVHP